MRILFSAMLFLFAANVAAETQYVSDVLKITLRTGQGTTYQILRTLESGTPVEVLEDAGQYTLVRTNDGVEGWVLTQYLTRTRIARDRLVQAEKRLERLKTDKQQLQNSLAELRKEKGTLEKSEQNLVGETAKLQAELARLREVAEQPIELDRQNRELKQQVQTLQREIDQLKSDNAHLEDRTQREWFITGAGVLLGGILLGLVLPLLRRKKKSGMFD